MKEVEGISQRTYMKDPWTQSMVWGLTMEVGGELGGGVKGGKFETTVIA